MPPGPTTDDRVVARVVLKRHQLPSMTPYPGPRSVLVMDNCLFHHNEEIKMVIQAAGVILHYLPPYAPDLNPVRPYRSRSSAPHWATLTSCLVRLHSRPYYAAPVARGRADRGGVLRHQVLAPHQYRGARRWRPTGRCTSL